MTGQGTIGFYVFRKKTLRKSDSIVSTWLGSLGCLVKSSCRLWFRFQQRPGRAGRSAMVTRKAGLIATAMDFLVTMVKTASDVGQADQVIFKGDWWRRKSGLLAMKTSFVLHPGGGRVGFWPFVLKNLCTLFHQNLSTSMSLTSGSILPSE